MSPTKSNKFENLLSKYREPFSSYRKISSKNFEAPGISKLKRNGKRAVSNGTDSKYIKKSCYGNDSVINKPVCAPKRSLTGTEMQIRNSCSVDNENFNVEVSNDTGNIHNKPYNCQLQKSDSENYGSTKS